MHEANKTIDIVLADKKSKLISELNTCKDVSMLQRFIESSKQWKVFGARKLNTEMQSVAQRRIKKLTTK